MDRRFLAVTGLLILAGLALAFAFVFIVSGENGRTEDIWLVPNPLESKNADQIPKTGSDLVQSVAKTTTTPRPAVTNDWSNVSKITLKILAYNQSAMLLLSPDGKRGFIQLNNTPETETGVLTTEQRKLAEKIALADVRVRDILGAGMYTEEIQPLDMIRAKDFGENTTNGTFVSIAFTMVNTTTAKNETTFFVHVDLGNSNVVRVSPVFPSG